MRINEAEWIKIMLDGSNLPADNDWMPYDTYNADNDYVFPVYKPGYFVRLMWEHKEATHYRLHKKDH